jgi:hypothetical protein
LVALLELLVVFVTEQGAHLEWLDDCLDDWMNDSWKDLGSMFSQFESVIRLVVQTAEVLVA